MYVGWNESCYWRPGRWCRLLGRSGGGDRWVGTGRSWARWGLRVGKLKPPLAILGVRDALMLRNVEETITRNRSKNIVNKRRQAEILAKAKALNFRQGPARATTQTMERRGVVRKGGRQAQHITSVVRRGRVRLFLRALASVPFGFVLARVRVLEGL